MSIEVLEGQTPKIQDLVLPERQRMTEGLFIPSERIPNSDISDILSINFPKYSAQLKIESCLSILFPERGLIDETIDEFLITQELERQLKQKIKSNLFFFGPVSDPEAKKTFEENEWEQRQEIMLDNLLQLKMVSPDSFRNFVSENKIEPLIKRVDHPLTSSIDFNTEFFIPLYLCFPDKIKKSANLIYFAKVVEESLRDRRWPHEYYWGDHNGYSLLSKVLASIKLAGGKNSATDEEMEKMLEAFEHFKKQKDWVNAMDIGFNLALLSATSVEVDDKIRLHFPIPKIKSQTFEPSPFERSVI